MGIVLGPYLIPEHQPASGTSELQPTGYSLQFLMVEEAITLPIYLRQPRWGKSNEPEFGDYFYPTSVLDQCKYFDMSFMYRPDMDRLVADGETFFSISTFLSALYQTKEIQFPIWRLMDDFATSLPIHAKLCLRTILPTGESLVASGIADMGFCLEAIPKP